MNELKSDNNLRQAVSRREQQLPPMPADLNKRLMQRIAESEPARSETKPRRHRFCHRLHPLYRRLPVEPYPQETLSNHQNALNYERTQNR